MEPQDSIIAQWQEPATVSAFNFSPQRWRLIWVSLGIVFAALLAYGIWKTDATFYLGAGVILAATASLVVQRRRPAQGLPITLTNTDLQVGKRSYPLKDLAGFWLHADAGTLAINVETKRRAALPISFLYTTASVDEARALFLQVLPELEARPGTINDTISRWLRL